MEAEQTAAALGALAQEHRLAAFRELVRAGPVGLSAGALAALLQLAPSSMSFHLAQLGHAKLVTQQRKGRSIIYTANFTVMNQLLSYLTANCCAGNTCDLADNAAQMACEVEV